MNDNPASPRSVLLVGKPYSGVLQWEDDLSVNISRSEKQQELPLLFSGKTSSIRRSKMKWVALFLASMLNFALYFNLHGPQSLQPPLQEIFDIGDSKFNIIYSVYSLPNIVLPLLGGFLIDFLGVRAAINLFGFFIIIGQGVFTYGTYIQNFQFMVIGRFIFGLGGESLTVSQLPFLAKWFSGKELSFAWGFVKAALRFGSSLSSFLIPKIYLASGTLYAPFLVGLALTVISWLFGLLLCYLDRVADKQESLLQTSDFSDDSVKFKDLKNLPFLLHLLMISYTCLYGSVFALSNNLNNILVRRFGFDVNEAGNLVMMIYLISAVSSPLVGILVTRFGKRIKMMFVATCILILSQMALNFMDDRTPDDPNSSVVFALVGTSIFFAMYSILFWPCIPLIVEKKVIGTTTGLITSVYNLLLTILPIGLGIIHDVTEDFHFGYFWTEIALILLLTIGLAIVLWIYFEDIQTGRRLDKSAKDLAMEEEFEEGGGDILESAKK